MDQDANFFETLKQILRHARDPEALDDHPWLHSLFVQEALSTFPPLREVSPGQQLISAIAACFRQLQPASPPKRGKRLDPRWGEFGLLAALYFTPFNHGTPFPSSFLDAWRRLDEAILYFVFGRPAQALPESDIEKYRLVGSDLEYGSASTLSDWHKKGLQRLSEFILNRERYLSRTQNKASIVLEPEQPKSSLKRHAGRSRRWLWWSLTLVLILLLGLGSFKGWKIYKSGLQVYKDVTGLQAMMGTPMETSTIGEAAPVLKHLQTDLSSFKREAQPLLWLSPKLIWVPEYGYDLASAPALLESAGHLLNASVLSIEAAQPLLDGINSESANLNPADITALLLQAQPQFAHARQELDSAITARKSVDAEALSSRVHNLLIQRLDPILSMADDGLSLAMAIPRIAGAGSEGPKTYLLLVQNEDELRPTGGFITSVGNLVLHNGQVISLDFEAVDNDDQEDWSKPYPAAPWQLQEYMNSRVLLLRDVNWFTDFPSTALWAEYLYAYTHSHSVDGVIAFDQHFLVMLLRQLGPLQVEGAPYPLTAENVIGYMRQAKLPPENIHSAEWYRKEFIGRIADAILNELSGGKHDDWRGMAGTLSQALAERHLLLQFDDPAMGAFLEEQGWDNSLHSDGGDFLMVTDTNIGFNKTSAVMDVSLSYDVDLQDLNAPESTLTILHKSNAKPGVPCVQWNTGEITGEEFYPIDRCYWTYLRVYKPAGTGLLEATPQAIPGDWMLLGEPVPARVDNLDEELPGVQGFGALLVVPAGESRSTSFRFSLPQSLLLNRGDSQPLTYRLHIQKQPGTFAVPVTVRIHLPNGAILSVAPQGAIVQGHHLLLETNLRTDLELEVGFSIP